MIDLNLLKMCSGKRVRIRASDENVTGILHIVTNKMIALNHVAYEDGVTIPYVSYCMEEVTAAEVLDPIDDICSNSSQTTTSNNPTKRVPHPRGNRLPYNYPVSVRKETPDHLIQIMSKEPSRPDQLLHLKVQQEKKYPREAPSLDLLRADLTYLEKISKSSAEYSYQNIPEYYIMLTEKDSVITKKSYQYLQQQTVLGVCCYGCETTDKLHLLAFSTNRLVVLIDPKILRVKSRSGEITIDNFPRYFLTSQAIQRIVYDGRWISAVLRKEFHMEVGHMIDLQVFSHGLFPTNKPRFSTVLPLSKLIAKFLFHHKHPYVLRYHERVEDESLWAERPLGNTMLNQAFFFISPLVPLYQRMLEFLLSPIMTHTNERIRRFKDLPDSRTKRLKNPLDSSDLLPYSKFWYFTESLALKRDMEMDSMRQNAKTSTIQEEEAAAVAVDCDQLSCASFSSDSEEVRPEFPVPVTHSSLEREIPDGGSSGEEGRTASHSDRRPMLTANQMTVNKSCDESAYFVSGVLGEDEPCHTEEDFCAIPMKRCSEPLTVKPALTKSHSSVSLGKGRGRSSAYNLQRDLQDSRESVDTEEEHPLNVSFIGLGRGRWNQSSDGINPVSPSSPSNKEFRKRYSEPLHFSGSLGPGSNSISPAISDHRDDTKPQSPTMSGSHFLGFGRSQFGRKSPQSLPQSPGSLMTQSSLSLRSLRIDEALRNEE